MHFAVKYTTEKIKIYITKKKDHQPQNSNDNDERAVKNISFVAYYAILGVTYTTHFLLISNKRHGPNSHVMMHIIYVTK